MTPPLRIALGIIRHQSKCSNLIKNAFLKGRTINTPALKRRLLKGCVCKWHLVRFLFTGLHHTKFPLLPRDGECITMSLLLYSAAGFFTALLHGCLSPCSKEGDTGTQRGNKRFKLTRCHRREYACWMHQSNERLCF